MNPIFDTLPEQKLAYMVLKKCGCTSIMGAFKNLRNEKFEPGDPKSIHRDKESTRRASHLNSGKDWFSFTIVRDPIRRFLSFYSDKILTASLEKNKTVQFPDVFGYQTNMNLDDVIEVTIGRKFEPDMHAIRQSEVLNEVGFELDYIGRFEDFDNSIAHVASETRIHLPVFHLNSNLRTPVLLTPDQFGKLSAHYREDQVRFCYPTDYRQWCELNVSTGSDNFQTQQGFVFEDEATLLDYQIRRNGDHFTIELSWQVHRNHSRARCIRVVESLGDDQNVLLRMPKVLSLADKCNDESIAIELVHLKYADIPSHVSPKKLFIDIYFWDPSQKKATLYNSNGGNRVILPLPSD